MGIIMPQKQSYFFNTHHFTGCLVLTDVLVGLGQVVPQRPRSTWRL